MESGHLEEDKLVKFDLWLNNKLTHAEGVGKTFANMHYFVLWCIIAVQNGENEKC